MQPRRSFRLLHDSDHLDVPFRHVVENPKFLDAEPVLRLVDPAKPLNPASARLGGLMPDVSLKRVAHDSTKPRRETLEVGCRLRSENDFKKMLNDEQKATYKKAIEDRKEINKRFRDLVKKQ